MRRAGMVMAMLVLVARTMQAQSAARTAAETVLPFVVGEELVYRASLGRFGGAGRGTMRVEAVEEVRGQSTYLLHSELRGRMMGLKAEDDTRSWLDPARMASLRFSKRERNPLSSFIEEVELHPDRRQWVAAGDSGDMTADAPLDELSFI
jgi:hypothetical protein